jgi:two-component system CheB/CheR fusion protein
MELAPYDRRGANIAIDGDGVVLTAKAGLALAMVFHELASNAAKYGALSTEGGRLAVAWTRDGKAAHRKLHLTWIETGGPAVKPPSRRDFGSRLIERSLIHEFDAAVSAEFKESGLRCAIDIPLGSEFGQMADPD